MQLEMNVIKETERLHQSNATVKSQSHSVHTFTSSRMRGDNDGQIVDSGEFIHRIDEHFHRIVSVYIFFAMQTDNEVLLRHQFQLLQNFSSFDIVAIMLQNFIHRTACLDDSIRRNALREQMSARDITVNEVHVTQMVYDFTIDFLRNALVKAPIAAFDVEDWNLPALRRNDGHTTIRIAENKHGIRSLFLQNFIYLGNDVARRLRRRTLRRIKIIVRRSHVKILKEHFVQFVIEILTCMNENMIDVLLEFRDDAGQLDDLRTRAHDSHDFCHTFSLKVSESSG